MKYKLTLLSLRCYLPDESDGDEIYILMNGQKVWPVKEKYLTVLEEAISLNVSFEIEKGDAFDFELWDHDFFSNNDLLGTLKVNASSHGKFTADFLKTGSDSSKYAIEYEIG